MAIREIRKAGDPCLQKKCKPVEQFDQRLQILIDDMFDTMYEADGVGLAAPQVGILKQVVVIDTTGNDPIVLINPQITATSGAVIDVEGCLSFPGKYGEVERPQKVSVKALDRHGEPITLTGEDLLARAFCHEIEHLEGKVFTERVIRYIEEE